MSRLLWLVALAALAACAEIEDDATIGNDSLAVVPVGPGTDPRVIAPPDTPRSPPAGEPAAPADTALQRR